MKKEFVMRGRTASGTQEVLNFSGNKEGYAYKLTEFRLFPSSAIDSTSIEMTGIINAGKTTAAPTDPNFNDEGCIATAVWFNSQGSKFSGLVESVINDTFLITQNLILMVQDSNSTPINWQCRFVSVKMSGSEEAATNYKQFTISD
jgi:hypothetical protein